MNYHALTAIPEMGQHDKETSRRVASKKKLNGTTVSKLVKNMTKWLGSKGEYYDEVASQEEGLTSKYVAQVICEYKRNH